MIWEKILRPILFLFNAEVVHDLAMFYLSIYERLPFLNKIMSKFFAQTTPRIKQKIFGLYFRTPIGLPAGMDKNAKASLVWGSFGFGWAQLGSVTNMPQKGNKKPRLWRLPKDRGLVVNYGLNNQGAEKIYQKLKNKNKKIGLWSISIAKSNSVALENAPQDYAASFSKLENLADIITINLSCPNVEDFAGLQSRKNLEPILQKISTLNKNKKPIWLKIGNNLNKKQLDDIIYLVKKYKIDAIVASNLSKTRDHLNLKSKNKDKPGGISGQPIKEQANKIIAYLYLRSEGKYKIIGTGGIFNGQDAYDKIKAGASLLQMLTGFIYGGPSSVKKTNLELDQLLKKDNFSHISQAVGLEADKYSL